jgi:hypothetical protein
MQENHRDLLCVMDLSKFPAVFASFLPERRHTNRIVTLSREPGRQESKKAKKIGLLA